MDAQQLIAEGKLDAALAALQDQVRKDASNAKYRIFLFQLLAVMGQWNRALTQLNVAAELDAAALPMAQTYREAIQCEALRGEIFAGKRAPLVFGEPQSWLALLIEALRLDGEGHHQRAAEARARAFEDAPAGGGTINGEPFAWMADADQRLGPVLEAIVNGRYFWIPFQRISRIECDAPADLRDAVWTPARFTWANGATTVGLIPTRYPDTRAGVDAGVDDSLLLARRTEWAEQGPLCGYGLGQRLLATDAAEYALMDVRTIAFEGNGAAEGEGEGQAAGEHG
ncbi:type VI secretion system accessory protein TagJ [Rugamonas apoptosis]|uniref:Virulence protein SciE type n=1 Tax=Rugamonas apoptosis TaxID=2758570 RepID=A0A7W2F9A5_9BURK|nr:type VI secretion system accessory protein TagJ [Rugamonas apoptosis]MBA5687502.1 virulence protein SciE type [Rugamonas apoptosis]